LEFIIPFVRSSFFGVYRVKRLINILSLFSLEVKEISTKVGRFGTRLLQKPVGSFGTLPTPEPVKRPAFNIVIPAR